MPPRSHTTNWSYRNQVESLSRQKCKKDVCGQQVNQVQGWPKNFQTACRTLRWTLFKPVILGSATVHMNGNRLMWHGILKETLGLLIKCSGKPFADLVARIIYSKVYKRPTAWLPKKEDILSRWREYFKDVLNFTTKKSADTEPIRFGEENHFTKAKLVVTTQVSISLKAGKMAGCDKNRT